MHPGTSSLHFLIGSHPVDLFQLGTAVATEQRSRGEAARPLVVATFGRTAVAAAAGLEIPAGYVGLAGGATRRATLESAVLNFSLGSTEIGVVLPPEAGGHAMAEWLDRARRPIAEQHYDLVFVTVDRSRLPLDLPPLEPTDDVSCFWELGDLHPCAPNVGDPTGYGDVAERLACQPAHFHGIHLYARTAHRRDAMRGMVDGICRSAGGRLVSSEVAVLEGYEQV